MMNFLFFVCFITLIFRNVDKLPIQQRKLSTQTPVQVWPECVFYDIYSRNSSIRMSSGFKHSECHLFNQLAIQLCQLLTQGRWLGFAAPQQPWHLSPLLMLQVSRTLFHNSNSTTFLHSRSRLSQGIFRGGDQYWTRRLLRLQDPVWLQVQQEC